MNTHRETSRTMNALLFSNPKRRKRLALRFAVLVVAASALGTAYWFTRPPELVWWRSPQIGESELHVRVLVPEGWVPYWARSEKESKRKVKWSYSCNFWPVDRRPGFLCKIFPWRQEKAELGIVFEHDSFVKLSRPSGQTLTYSINGTKVHAAGRDLMLSSQAIYASVDYDRADLSAFNRTYHQIWESLTIE